MILKSKPNHSKWKHSEEPRLKNARQVQSNVKVLLTVFFDCNGILPRSYMPIDSNHSATFTVLVVAAKKQ